ncbi:MAG: S-layer homology domain-containing protein [Halanaerobiales bacterium]
MRQKLIVLTIITVLVLSSTISATDIKDVPSDHWAYQNVSKLVDQGLLQLYEDDTFRGNESLTRYQLAEIVARILERIESGGVQASDEDMGLLRDLSVEFREELVDLAVQGDAFAERLKEMEQKNLIQDEIISEIKDVDISELNSEIENLSEKITNVESDVTQIIDSILKIKQLEERIAILESTNDEQSALIEENQAQIDELREASIEATDETIADLENRISINATRLRSLQQEVNSLRSEVEGKNSEIQQLEEEKSNNNTLLYGVGAVALLLLLSN